MAFETFAIPEPAPPSLADVQASLAAQARDMNLLAAALYGEMGGSFAAQEQALGQIQQATARVINGSLRSQANKLQQVQQAATAAISESLGAQAYAASQLPVAPAPTVPAVPRAASTAAPARQAAAPRSVPAIAAPGAAAPSASPVPAPVPSAHAPLSDWEITPTGEHPRHAQGTYIVEEAATGRFYQCIEVDAYAGAGEDVDTRFPSYRALCPASPGGGSGGGSSGLPGYTSPGIIGPPMQILPPVPPPDGGPILPPVVPAPPAPPAPPGVIVPGPAAPPIPPCPACGCSLELKDIAAAIRSNLPPQCPACGNPILAQPPAPPDVQVLGSGDERPDTGAPPPIKLKAPGKGGKILGPKWCDLQVCASIDAVNVNAQAAIKDVVIAIMGTDVTDPSFDADAWARDQVKQFTPKIPLLLRGWFDEPLRAVLHGMGAAAQWVVSSGAWSGDCAIGPLALPMLVRAVTDLTHKYLGLGLGDSLKSLAQWTDYICPSEIPSPAESDSIYLAGLINDAQWRCWVRAGNQCEEPHRLVMQAGRTRPGIRDIIELARRNLLDNTVVEYPQRMRGEGILASEPLRYWEDLQRPWPSLDTVVRRVAAGVYDDPTAALWGLDGEYGTIQGHAVSHALGVGTTPALQGEAWRAHWRIPSPDEVMDAYARAPLQGKDLALPPYRLALDTAFRAANVPPLWRPIVEALHNKPLRVGQVRKAFVLGALDETGATRYLQAADYRSIDIPVMLVDWQAARLQHWIADRWGKLFVEGAIPVATMLDAMSRYGVRGALASSIVTELTLYRQSLERRRCIVALRGQYLHGAFSDADARQALASLGLDALETIEHVQTWSCERSARPKAVPAEKLCRWRQAGLISPADFAARLASLGYTPSDIRAIQADCAARAAAQASAAAAKQAATTGRKAAAAAAARARAKEAGAKVLARQARLVAKVARLTGQPVAAIEGPVQVAYAQLVATGRYTPNQAMAVLEGAYANAKGKGAPPWLAALAAAVEAALL